MNDFRAIFGANAFSVRPDADKLIKMLEKEEMVDEGEIEDIIVSDHENEEHDVYIDEDDPLAEYVYEPIESNDDEEVVLYNCDACNMDFEDVDEHMEKYHSNQDVVLDVDESDGQNALEAFNEVQVESAEQHDCSSCNRTFDSESSLSIHMRSTHENRSTPRKTAAVESAEVESAVLEHVCSICNTSFASAKSYKLHARMHNRVKAKPSEDPLETELAMMPLEEELQEKFYCNICEKYYLRNYEEIHMQMHNGEEKFNCKICNKLFPNDAAIKMHMNAHQESRFVSPATACLRRRPSTDFRLVRRSSREPTAANTKCRTPASTAARSSAGRTRKSSTSECTQVRGSPLEASDAYSFEFI